MNNVTEGNAPGNRPNGSVLECGDEPHQYAENGSAYSCTCNGGHGEARVLDTLPKLSAFAGQGLSGSSLVLNITVKTPLTERKREHNKEASLKAR